MRNAVEEGVKLFVWALKNNFLGEQRMTLIITWLLSAVCLYLTAAIVPGFKLQSFGASMWAVVVIGFFNMFLRPILWFLTLPINFLTLGLFTFVLNAIILKIAAKFLKGLDIDGWIPAIIGAVVLAIIQSLIFTFVDGGATASMPNESAV
jgi:putative membrane protein